MITSVDNCILKTAADIDPRYIVFQLSTQAYLYYVRSVARGGTRDRVSRSILGSISVILPPPGEQRAIADHIAVQVSALRRAVDQAEHEIELLREYRTRLIADVVTGKLDVRAAAANLPDEADEPEDIRLDDAEMVAETNEEMDRANFDAQCEGANI
jgi:type I restriction enzyme S subunit